DFGHLASSPTRRSSDLIFNLKLLECIDVVQIFKRLYKSRIEGFFTFSDPDSRVIKLLIRLVVAFRITDLRFQIFSFFTHIIEDRSEEHTSELQSRENLV